jgi:hypothetical protein
VHARYYALRASPSANAFGAPEYVDGMGRQYRMAYAYEVDEDDPTAVVPPRPADAPLIKGTGGGGADRVKLWVKLPRKRHRFGATATPDLWFQGSRLLSGGIELSLEPVLPGLPRLQVQVREAYREQPTHRGGYIYVTGI